MANQLMNELLIHPTSKVLIESYLKRPAHGLLLSGPIGVGLKTIAAHIAHRIDDKAYIQEVNPDEKFTIAIETVRGLYRLTRAQRDTALVVIIDDAEAMGREAQNALLKLLEEPINNVHFILTSHMPQQLLPTITSRVQSIALASLAHGKVDALITSSTSAATKAQLLFIADGLPAEITRLQSDETYFARSAKQMKDARAFLEGDAYTRLLFVKEYGTDRVAAGEFLSSLTTLLSFMLFARHDPSYIAQLESIEEISSRLRQNAHIRTQLTYLVTQL